MLDPQDRDIPEDDPTCPDCGEDVDPEEGCEHCGWSMDDDGPEPDDGSDSQEVAAAEWGGIDYP